ncbi:MAG: hypothetical protein ACOC3T_04680 [Bacteroidota bacterium]
MSFCCYTSWGQNKMRGVSIANDTLPPHPSTILDVRSESKGVLVTRISSYSELDNIGDNQAEGLLVFVMSPEEQKGFHYYRDGGWVKLKAKKQSYPMGAIIMYAGDITDNDFYQSTQTGTNPHYKGQGKSDKFSGWQICNGEGNSPDLTDRFIVMVDNENVDRSTQYNLFGSSEIVSDDEHCDPTSFSGKTCNSWNMSINTMPKHTHDFPLTLVNNGIDYTHKHEFINEEAHSHIINAVNKQKRGTKYRLHPNRESFNKDLNKSVEKIDAKDYVTIGDSPEDASVKFYGKIEKKGSSEVIDNRPPFYALIFLMKTNYNEENYKEVDTPFIEKTEE